MKFSHRLVCFAGTLVLLPLVVLRAGAASAESVASAKPTEPRPLSLFMGTDISVERDKKLFRVRDINGGSFVISVDGRNDLVPMRGSPRNLKIDHTLKLTGTSASVTGLVGERAYTPGNDPRMKRQIEDARVNTALGDAASLAMGQYSAVQMRVGNPLAEGGGVMAAKEAEAVANVAARAANALEMARVAGDRQMSSSVSGADAQFQAQRDLAENRFDAVEVEFTVSSEAPLANPYMVLLVHYLEKEGLPDTARNMVYARSLEPIGTKPRKVHALQGGLPPGYVLQEFQVHLYNDGVEIATDVAPKRVALTRDQAFQYLKADYLRQHRGETLAAIPAIGKLDADTQTRLTHAQLTGRYFVKVSSEGQSLATFADEACTQQAESEIAALAEKVRFFPALENGKRVEGTARLVFTQLNL
jgi:hypothetical protein